VCEACSKTYSLHSVTKVFGCRLDWTHLCNNTLSILIKLPNFMEIALFDTVVEVQSINYVINYIDASF